MKYQNCHGEIVDVKLNAGDVIDLRRNGLSIEIGANNTMRALINGQPDPKGWKPITADAEKELCKYKVYF